MIDGGSAALLVADPGSGHQRAFAIDGLDGSASIREREDCARRPSPVRCDITFHDAVFAAAGHQLLADWDGIRCQIHLFLLTRIGRSAEGYLDRIPGEHRELVAALRARDTDTAVGFFAAHRRHAVDVITGTVVDPG